MTPHSPPLTGEMNMTDPIAEGVKLEDAIVILREGLRSDRPLTLKERLLIGKIIDERAALTAAGEMAKRVEMLQGHLERLQERLDPSVGEDVVDRVAKAIYATKGFCYTDDDRMFQPLTWEEHDEITQESCRTEARAALAAIGRT